MSSIKLKQFLPYLLCFLAINSYASAEGFPIEGRYQSQISSSGMLWPGEVNFFRDASGLIKADFYYEEFGEPVPAKLDYCRRQSIPALFLCRWSDKYGTGLVLFEFSDDYQSFKGYWNSGEEQSLTQPWSGKR